MSDAIVILVRVLRLWAHVHQPADPDLAARRKRHLFQWAEVASCHETFEPARSELISQSAAIARHGSPITAHGQEAVEKRVGRPIALGMRRACQIACDRAHKGAHPAAPHTRHDCIADPSEVIRLTRVLRLWARMARVKQRGFTCNHPTEKLLSLSALAASAADLNEAEARIRQHLLLGKQTGSAGYGGTGGAPTRLLAHALWRRLDVAFWLATSPHHRGAKPGSAS
jgi:hypothetical protein